MREVVIQTLTREAFAPFGTYAQMDQPQGVALTGDCLLYTSPSPRD